jgi:hypothetical protein
LPTNWIIAPRIYGQKPLFEQFTRFHVRRYLIILAILIILIGTYYFVERILLDKSPPSIINLSWTPTRENLDKIYDINVTFVARDDKTPIAYAELRFIPVEYYYMIEKYGMRPEDYPKVFPPDKERDFVLTPVDGKFDSLEEKFSVPIKDIIGGREYKIVVLVRDKAGNERIVEVKTPYIRQFENLGKVLYEKGTLVAAVYYALYPYPHTWEALEPMAAHPLLGKYDVRDPIVQAKHIDWFTGYGGNCFFFSWGTDDDSSTKEVHENILSFISNPLSNQVKIAIFYELPSRLRAGGIFPNGQGLYHLDDPRRWGKVIEDMKLLSEDILQKENYLKIKNEPIIEFYETAIIGNIPEFVNSIKRAASDSLFIISQHAHPWSATSAYTDPPSGGWIEDCIDSGYCELFERAKPFDGWTTWVAGWYTPIKKPLNENYPKFLEEGYKVWNRLAEKYNKMFVPSILPGFINLRDPNFPRLPRSAEMFKRELEIALKYATPVNGMRVIRIDTFNEFGEATGIEPTREEGFIYLEGLKGILYEEILHNTGYYCHLGGSLLLR